MPLQDNKYYAHRDKEKTIVSKASLRPTINYFSQSKKKRPIYVII
jgi:hypothetical protein